MAALGIVNNSKVFIGNLPQSVNHRALKEFLEESFGTLESMEALEKENRKNERNPAYKREFPLKIVRKRDLQTNKFNIFAFAIFRDEKDA